MTSLGGVCVCVCEELSLSRLLARSSKVRCQSRQSCSEHPFLVPPENTPSDLQVAVLVPLPPGNPPGPFPAPNSQGSVQLSPSPACLGLNTPLPHSLPTSHPMRQVLSSPPFCR